jgi:hypothetical protein
MDVSNMGYRNIVSLEQRDRIILWVTAPQPYPRLTAATTMKTFKHFTNTNNNKIPPAHRPFCLDMVSYFLSIVREVNVSKNTISNPITIKGNRIPTQMQSLENPAQKHVLCQKSKKTVTLSEAVTHNRYQYR